MQLILFFKTFVNEVGTDTMYYTIYTYMGRIPSARCCEVLGKINLIKKKKKNNNTSFVKDIPMSKSIKNGLFRYSQRVPMLESYFCGFLREWTQDIRT